MSRKPDSGFAILADCIMRGKTPPPQAKGEKQKVKPMKPVKPIDKSRSDVRFADIIMRGNKSRKAKPSVHKAKPSVHIEDLWNAMTRFRQAQIKSMEFFRQPKQAAKIMEEAEAEFKQFCADNNLDVDFTPR